MSKQIDTVIRRGRSDDVGAIVDLWNWMIVNTAWTFTSDLKTPAQIDALIARSDTEGGCFVADHAGAVNGFVTYSQFRNGPGYAHSVEHSIVLREGSSGAGIGKRLMAAAEDHARANDKHVMVAGISSANSRGVQFHEAIGYTHVGRMAEVGRKNDEWLDLILMQKIL